MGFRHARSVVDSYVSAKLKTKRNPIGFGGRAGTPAAATDRGDTSFENAFKGFSTNERKRKRENPEKERRLGIAGVPVCQPRDGVGKTAPRTPDIFLVPFFS
jgi:hypothetical protein